MANPTVQIRPLLQDVLPYLASRRAWRITGKPRSQLPLALAAMEAELNQPRLEALGFCGWREAIRLAGHLATVERQPTLLACRHGPLAAALGLIAEATGLPHFRLTSGMTSAGELAKAGEAAKSLADAPLTFADARAGMDWDEFEPCRVRCVLLDWPLDPHRISDLARVGQLAGVRLFSPVAFYPPRDSAGRPWSAG